MNNQANNAPRTTPPTASEILASVRAWDALEAGFAARSRVSYTRGRAMPSGYFTFEHRVEGTVNGQAFVGVVAQTGTPRSQSYGSAVVLEGQELPTSLSMGTSTAASMRHSFAFDLFCLTEGAELLAAVHAAG